MGLFDRIKTTAGGIGVTVARGAGQIAGKATTGAKEQAKIVAVKAEISSLQADIDVGYVAIGRAYVEACLAGKEVPDIGAGATLKMIEPKLEKQMELEKELVELEKSITDSQVMLERQLVQKEVDDVKAKLDKAKSMGIISDSDYEAKLAAEMKKLEYFEDIRNLKKQKEIGLISAEELEAKMKELLG